MNKGPRLEDTRRARLGFQLRAARVRLSLTQEQAAALVPTIPRSGLSDIERGVRDVSALELADLSRAYGVPVAVLLEIEKKGSSSGPNLYGLSKKDIASVRQYADFLRWLKGKGAT